MSDQAQTEPAARELRGSLTVTVPITVLERLQPLASSRAKSGFVTQAIRDAFAREDAEATKAREPQAV
jgi:hypothetical protein